MFASPVPRRHKGRIAIVTNVARNAVDVNVPIDERRGRGRRSRVVLAPQGLALKVAMMPAHHADDGGKRNGSPGRARISCNPSRGEGRLSPPVPVVYARFAQIFCAEAPGACGHPAFPAPSVFREGDRNAKLGRIASRESGVVPLHRHCERSEAIQSHANDSGLLRSFAPRNCACSLIR